MAVPHRRLHRYGALIAILACACRHDSPRVDLHGVVLGASGRPASGAVVAANRPGENGSGIIAVSRADGSYVLPLDKDGIYALTATNASDTAAYVPPSRFAAPVTIRLEDAAQGFTVSGHVSAIAALPAEVTVRATRLSDFTGDVFVTRADAAGNYRMRLPRARYTLEARGAGGDGVPKSIREVRDQEANLDLYMPAAPRAEVVDETRLAEAPLADFDALDRIVGDAHLVGLGEATHGTHEFFELKRRIFEHLVTKKGFRAIAFEAARPEARRVDAYVLEGRGTAAEALAGLHYWTWDTEEVRALIEWMRAYDATAKPEDKVHFLGLDMEYTALAAEDVHAYLDELDPDFARSLPTVFASGRVDDEWAKLSADERAKNRAAADATVHRLDTQRDTYVTKSTRERWLAAREDARVIAQWAEVHGRDARPGAFDFTLRDVAMAENVDEMIASEPGKIVLWAHNGHVGLELPPLQCLGEILRTEHRSDYVAIGLLFGQGGFQARGGPSSPQGNALQNFTIGLAPDSDATTPLSRLGLDAILDLRALPAGPARDWFAAAHPVRDIGIQFTGESGASLIEVLSRRYDAIAFVAKTTPARPNPTGRRGP